MLGIHSVQQTLIRCLLCASKGAARGSLGFHQGLAFPRLPTEPPTAAGGPPPPQWAGLPHPSLHPASPRPKSSQVQAETRGSLGIAAGGGGWARSPDTLAAPPTCPQPGFFAWKPAGCLLPFLWKQVRVFRAEPAPGPGLFLLTHRCLASPLFLPRRTHSLENHSKSLFEVERRHPYEQCAQVLGGQLTGFSACLHPGNSLLGQETKCPQPPQDRPAPQPSQLPASNNLR